MSRARVSQVRFATLTGALVRLDCGTTGRAALECHGEY